MKSAITLSALVAGGASTLALAKYTAEALADQVTNLPGAEDLDFSFNQFSGYLKVNNTKNLHYWYASSSMDISV